MCYRCIRDFHSNTDVPKQCAVRETVDYAKKNQKKMPVFFVARPICFGLESQNSIMIVTNTFGLKDICSQCCHLLGSIQFYPYFASCFPFVL